MKGGGRIAGRRELTLRLTELEIDGESYAISAARFRVCGAHDAVESAATIGGGAVVGGILGGVLGGGGGCRGWGAIGTCVAIATQGDQLVLPVGQKLRVRLSEPVSITVAGKARA